MEKKILIVGAGPTGLTVALELARKGIKPRIIDKREESITTSNALFIQARTLEIWKEMELIDDALLEGLRLRGFIIYKSGTPLGKLIFDDLPTPYPFALGLPQAKTEQLLAKHLAKYGVTVERGVTLENLSENENGVEAICSGKADTYSWVIGCDGAKSDVRRLAEIPFRGDDLPQHFVMTDLKIDWDQDPHFGSIYYSDTGASAFFPLDDQGLGRLIFDVTGDEKLKEETHPTFEEFKELYKQRCAVKATLHEPYWTSGFWIHSRLADTYRKGRLFLAGDAAHLHSPFGGQGLNTGVQDAYFLAKLLADVLQGKEEEKVLDDYNKVRHSIGKEVVQITALMTRLITTQSKLLRLVRDTVFFLVTRIPFLHHKVTMRISELIYR